MEKVSIRLWTKKKKDSEQQKTFDLCIVGAGMFGSAVARHASADPRLSVCLVGTDEPTTASEWGRREIHASYYDEGRIVLGAEHDAAVQQLARASMDRFRELERLSGIQFYCPVGTLIVGERNSPCLQNWMEELRTSGTPFADLSSNDVFSKRFPYLQLEPGDFPLFDDSGAGYVSPRRMVEAEQEMARLQGCARVRDVVREVREEGSGEEGTYHVVMTEGGTSVRCRRLLLCAGAFTKFKNLMAAPKLKCSVHRETAALLRVTREESQRLSGMPPILKNKTGIADMPAITTGVYILPPVQYPDRHFYVKVGPMGHHRDSEIRRLEECGEWYSRERGDAETLDKLPKLLARLIPGLRVEEVRSKTCVTSDSPSGLPYVDRLTPTVAVAAVGNGMGAMICEEVGRLAAALAVEGRWDSRLPKEIFEAAFE